MIQLTKKQYSPEMTCLPRQRAQVENANRERSHGNGQRFYRGQKA